MENKQHEEHPHPLPETDTPIRPYAHLIDSQADQTLFDQVCPFFSSSTNQ